MEDTMQSTIEEAAVNTVSESETPAKPAPASKARSFLNSTDKTLYDMAGASLLLFVGSAVGVIGLRSARAVGRKIIERFNK